MTDFDIICLTDEERAWIAGNGNAEDLRAMADKRAFGSHCKTYNDYTLFMVQARDSHQDEWPTAKQVAAH